MRDTVPVQESKTDSDLTAQFLGLVLSDRGMGELK
jgi:hypothetical protein